MKNSIFPLIFILLVFSVSAKIPIGKAIENGIKLNLDIINIDTELKIIEIENRIKRSDRYFRISSGGNYLFRSEKIEIQFPDIMIAPGSTVPGQKFEGGTFHNFDINISLFQPLFTGNVLSNLIRIGDLKRTLNMNRREVLSLLIKGKIKSVFLKHILLESEKRSLELLKKKIDNHLHRLEDLFREELVGKSQILETEIRSGEISLKIEDVKNNMKSVELIFHELCGYPISEVEPFIPEQVPGKEDSLNAFIKNHPNFKIFSDQKIILEVSKKVVKGGNLPQIGGFAELHHGRPGFNFFSDEWSTYFQGGINIVINLFDQGKSRRENVINDYKINKIKNMEKDLVRKTGFRLSDLYGTLASLRKRLKTIKKMVAISVEESELKKMMFLEKQISNREYLDSVFNVENLRSLRDKIRLQEDLIKVEINTLIGH